MKNTRFLTGIELYKEVLCDKVLKAGEFVWIATSDIKDLHVHKGSRMVPFLEILSDLIKKGIAIRLLHAKEPGPAFRNDFDRYPNLIDGLERILCPRVHFKSIVIDGTYAYTGSANLTGAGIGAKSPRRRNFEAGFVTTDSELVARIMEQFDSLWMAKHCPECGRKKYCADARDMIEGN